MAKKTKLPDHLHLYKRIDLVPSWKSKLPETHKYYRPSHEILVCTEPLCNYRLELNQAVGKLCKCNRCGQPMIIDKETVKLTKPHCQSCIERKNKSVIVGLDELLKDI